MTEETSNARMFSISSAFVTQTPFTFHPWWMSGDFICPSNDILDINKNILMLTLGLKCKERAPHNNKTNISWTWNKQTLHLRAGWPLWTAAKQTASKIQLDHHLAISKMGSPIFGTSTLCPIVLLHPVNEEIPKSPHCWPFSWGIY